MKKSVFTILGILGLSAGQAQVKDTSNAAHIDTLNDVTVSAFAWQAKWKDVPAAVAVVTQADLHTFNNGSLVSTLACFKKEKPRRS